MQTEQTKSIFKIPLIREITVVLIIKLILIFFIKWQFFSDPVDLTQPSNSVEQHMGLSNTKTPTLDLEKNDG